MTTTGTAAWIVKVEGQNIELNAFREPIGFRQLSTVWPSAESVEANRQTVLFLAQEKGLDQVPASVRIHSTGSGKEYFMIPSLGVWWVEDFA